MSHHDRDDGDPLHPLTPREREVLELLRLGLTNGEIAGRLEITLDGAKYHVSEIISKLGVRDRHEAASYPERRLGWALALAPIAFLWRQAGALVSAKASSVALVASVGLGAAALGGIGLIVFFLVQGGGEGGEAPAPEEVLSQLGPGTTFHTVDVIYRRYGPAAAEIPPSEGPERRRNETWITFDDTGALASFRFETRDMDGVLLDSGALEGYQGLTVGSLKGSIANAITETRDRLSNRPDAPPDEIDGRAVVVLEDRRPFRSGVPAGVATGSGTGFEIPHVADLNPVEEIRRSYVLPDEFRSVRSEVVVVSGDGTETVVESRDHEVFEVLRAVVPQVEGGGGVGEAPAPVIRGLAPGEQAPDCVLRPDGSVMITSGRDLCFDPARVAVGDVVRVTATKWEEGFPVEFYLLTEEQMELTGKARFDADLVWLGQLDLEGREVSFAFTLADSFETVTGNRLRVASGDRLALMGYQRTNGGAGSSGTGPLVVR